MIKKEFIGAKIIKHGHYSVTIKDDPKSIKLYKALGLDIFEPKKKDAINSIVFDIQNNVLCNY